jgi:hydrogenase/urease accessory protein HupE
MDAFFASVNPEPRRPGERSFSRGGAECAESFLEITERPPHSDPGATAPTFSALRGLSPGGGLSPMNFLPRRPAFGWGPLWMLLWALWAGTLAQAHPLIQNPLWVLLEPGRAQVAVQVSLREIAAVQGVAADAPPERLALAARKHGDYVLEHLTLSVGARILKGALEQLTAPAVFRDGEKTFFQYELSYRFEPAATGAIRISHRMLEGLSETPGQPWDVSYVVRLKRGQSAPVEAFLLRNAQSLELPSVAPAGAGGAAPPFTQYLLEGIWHILTGYDHLLFVSALVLAAASFWEMVRVVAAFTVAHSLTLALSALNLVRLPESVVEPLIAASIVVVALENIFWPGLARLRLGMAFGFGLIHGLGFAGGLLDAMQGLPKLGMSLAILAFSLGVELGHQCVVLPLFGLLRWGRIQWRDTFRAGALRYGSLAVSFGGFYYLYHALRGA